MQTPAGNKGTGVAEESETREGTLIKVKRLTRFVRQGN